MMQTFTPKHSSNVAKFEYDPQTKEMHVTFVANPKKPYIHTGLRPEHFAALQQDPSPGRYYHAIIKRYPLKKEHHERSSTA